MVRPDLRRDMAEVPEISGPQERERERDREGERDVEHPEGMPSPWGAHSP
jgi:hypothetical protein